MSRNINTFTSIVLCFVADPLGEEEIDFDEFRSRQELVTCVNSAISIIKVSSSEKISMQNSIKNPIKKLDYNRSFVCEGCGFKFKQHEGCKRHQLSCKFMEVGPRPEFPCEGCGHKFTRLHGLNRHQQGNSCKGRLPGSKFPCKKCGYVFDKLCQLKKHQESNGCESNLRFLKFPCQKCGDVFNNVIDLQCHQRDSSCKEIFATVFVECKDCHAKFLSGSNLVRHHRLNRCSYKKKLATLSTMVCYVCSETFDKYQLLQKHLEICRKA